MMMSLGLFAFSLSSAAYRDLQRQTAWRHAGSDRIGARAATQFLGPGNDTITLSGLIAPDLTGDPASLDTLRDMADWGQPWTLVDGNGNVHGAWVIESLQESRSLFFADGSARRIEFRLQLKQVDGQNL